MKKSEEQVINLEWPKYELLFLVKIFLYNFIFIDEQVFFLMDEIN